MNRYWTLAAKPTGGLPTPETFVLREGPIPTTGPGQALSRTIYVSLDPYQWGYKTRGVDAPGAVCHARTVSQVIESRMDGFVAGDLVFNVNGWQEYGLMGAGVPRPTYMVPRRLDPSIGRISQAVGVLGMLGLTAYAGMVLMADPRPGETAVVSAASGGEDYINLSCCGDTGWNGYYYGGELALQRQDEPRTLVLHITPFWAPASATFHGDNALAVLIRDYLVQDMWWHRVRPPSAGYRLRALNAVQHGQWDA